jgi:hypothetical protein
MYLRLNAHTNYRSITIVHASVYVWSSHFVTLHLPQFFSDSSTQLLAHVHIYVSKRQDFAMRQGSHNAGSATYYITANKTRKLIRNYVTVTYLKTVIWN